MDVISKRISLTAWGRLYGFDKATTSRLHLTGRLPPELQIEQLPSGRYYVVVPPGNDARCVVYARVSSGDQREDLNRQVGRVVAWATEHGHRPDEVVKEIGSGLNGHQRRLQRSVGNSTVGMIMVEQCDRLCRLGLEYVEAALAGTSMGILVVEDEEIEDDLVRGRHRCDDVAVGPFVRETVGAAPGGRGRWRRRRSDDRYIPDPRHRFPRHGPGGWRGCVISLR